MTPPKCPYCWTVITPENQVKRRRLCRDCHLWALRLYSTYYEADALESWPPPRFVWVREMRGVKGRRAA